MVFRRVHGADPRSLRLEFTSAFEMLDFVQVVSDHVGRDVGLDDDAVHWVGVAIRESVINAIKHGNQNDAGKHVFVEFETRVGDAAAELDHPRPRPGRRASIPSTLADPLAPENLLKASGRGIFLIRSFMDDVQPAARAGGRHGDPHDQARAAGRRIRQRLTPCPDPLYPHHRHRSRRPRRRRHDVALRHATSASTRRARSISSPRSTSPSSAIFRADDRRALSRSRGARRGAGRQRRARPPGPCWVFDPIDGTTNFAHGLPIFCASLALEIDGVAEVAAVYDPTRRELFTAERGGGAFLNGRPLRVSAARDARRRDARHRLPLRRAPARRRDRRALRARSSAGRAPCGGSDRRPSISATSPPAAWTGSGRATSSRGTSPAAR